MNDQGKGKEDIHVQVHYIAAANPFVKDFSPQTTVATLKAEALDRFKLVEDGTKIYKLFLHKNELNNPAATLADVSDGKHDLNIDLEEFITQG
jgi:hypothetical protein